MGRRTIPSRGEDQFLCKPHLPQSVPATPSFIIRNCSTSGFKANTILSRRANSIPLPCPLCSLLCSPLTPGMASASLVLQEGWSSCSSCPTLGRDLSSPLPQGETIGYFTLLGKKTSGLWIHKNEPYPAVLPTEEDGLPGQSDRADLERYRDERGDPQRLQERMCKTVSHFPVRPPALARLELCAVARPTISHSSSAEISEEEPTTDALLPHLHLHP